MAQFLSVIVHIVHVKGIAVGKTKHYSPVGANGNGVETSQVALEQVQPKARSIHILDGLRSIESGQNVTQFPNMLGSHTARVVVLVEPLQSLMAYRAEHLQP